MSRHHRPSATMSVSSSRPISLDLHQFSRSSCNNINNNSSYTNSLPQRNRMIQKNDNVISLDNFSDDDITTTSGSELFAAECITASSKKYSGRKHHHPYQHQQHQHVYQISNDSSDSENDFYHPPSHQRRTQQQPRALEMIQEISPVLPENSDNDSDMPARMPLRYAKEFNPLQTSTMTSFHHQPHQQQQLQQQHLYHHPRPITNPHHIGPTSTPLSYHPLLYEERIPSLFENHRPYHQPTSAVFGLDPMLAKKYNSNGILFLEISIMHKILSIKVRNANFFFENGAYREVNSYCVVQTKPNPDRHRRRDDDPNRFQQFKTKIIKRKNCPEFFQTFQFKIGRRNRECQDFLSVSVYAVEESPGPVGHLLGCMSFPLERLFRKAGIYDCPDYGKRYKKSSSHDVMEGATSVMKGGFFLLGKELGTRRYLEQSKIRKQKFYDDIGASSISTCSSSPIKMMSERDWMNTPSTINRGQQILSRFNNGIADFSKSGASSSCYQTPPLPSATPKINGSGIPKKRSSLTGAMINGLDSNDLSMSSPSTSSSSNSSSTRNGGILTLDDRGRIPVSDFSTSNSSSSISAGINFKRGAGHKRYTLPSITTTSDSNSEFGEAISLGDHNQIDYHYLYADDPPMSTEPQHQPPQRRQRRQIGSLDSGIIPLTHEECDEDFISEEEEEEENNVDVGRRFKKIASKEIQQDVKKVGSKFGAMHPSVRRVASFTSPPTKTEIAKAAQQHQREQRRGFLGKTFHFLRKKVENSTSHPSLIPTKEEVKSWQEKMDYLFESKFGVMLFREFLEKEFSSENLDFLLKCREYQKLFQAENPASKKIAQKIARLAKEIDEEFLQEDFAPREINLEAHIRASTRAAVHEKLKPDTFSLAQKQIQTLIGNDKYQRFLKSHEYQNLLQTVTLGSQSSIQSALPEVPYTDSDGSSTPCQTANEDTPLAPAANRTLRSASALETFGPISTINE